MRGEHERFSEHGGRLVVIGNGKPHHARMFMGDETWPMTLWVDPGRATYRALSFARGVSKVFTLGGVPHMRRAWKAGFRQGRVQGDPWQNGGAIVVDRTARILLHQVSREAGDHVAVDELLAALDRAQG